MSEITLVAVGDIILEPDSHDRAFARIKPVLEAGDITFGNCDQVYSDLGESPNGFWPIQAGAVPHSTAMLDSLVDAGFDVLGFGNNHILDWGYEAFLDSLSQVRGRGLEPLGAGKDLPSARKPVIVERNANRVGFLAYCCVGFEGYEATADRPGHVPMRIHTHYEQWDPQPGTPPLIHTFGFREDLRELVEDVESLRGQVDVVVVAFHWGVHYIPELIADYQHEVGHAAIDAGADIVLGCHAHLPKGIEVYGGKAIFHGMHEIACRGAWSSPATQPGSRFPESKTWDWTRYGSLLKERFGEVPKEITRYAMIARITIRDGRISRVAYLPCVHDADLHPVIVTRDDPRGQIVFDYYRKISRSQGLDTEFSWDGDEVVVHT